MLVWLKEEISSRCTVSATVNRVKNFVETTEKKPTPLTSIPQERRTITQLSEEFHREARNGQRRRGLTKT